MQMRFYEFSRLSIFFPIGDLHIVFYRLHGSSTNSNIPLYPRKGEKIF